MNSCAITMILRTFVSRASNTKYVNFSQIQNTSDCIFESVVSIFPLYIYEPRSVKRGFNASALSVVPDKPVQSAEANQGRYFPLL